MQIRAKSDYSRVLRTISQVVGLPLVACDRGRFIHALKTEPLESDAVVLQEQNLILRCMVNGAISRAPA